MCSRKRSLLLAGSLSFAAAPVAAQEPCPDAARAELATHLLDRRTREVSSLLADWRSASGAAKLALEAQITGLAVERRGYLEESIRRDARSAWHRFLSSADRLDLESIAPGTVVLESTLTGDLEVHVLEDLDAGVSVLSRSLVEPDGTRTLLYPATAEDEAPSSGPGITITGHKIGNFLVYNGQLPPGPCQTPTTGTLEYLLVRADFTNAPLPSHVTGTLLNQLYNVGSTGEPRSVNEYFLEASFGQLDLQSTVHPGVPIDLGIDAVFETGPVLDATVAALESQGVVLSQYDGLVLFMDWTSVLPTPSNPLFNFRNQATIGRTTVQTSSGPICLAVSYMGDRWPNFTLNLHETGHTLGMLHASFYKNSSVERPISPASIVNYGDPLSIMGYNEPNAGHVNFQHKQKDLGWLVGGDFALIDPTALPTTVPLAPISVTTGALQGIKVPRGAGDALYVEFRYVLDGAKYDTASTLVDTNAFTPGGQNGGAMAYIRHTTSKRTLLFDPDGTYVSTSAMKAVTADSFTDPCSGVRVTAQSIDTSGPVPLMTIAVDADGVPCTQFDPPVVVIDQPTPGSVLSGVVELRATATDDIGVAGVQFILDERPIGLVTTPSDGTNTYVLDWDTTDPQNGASNGPHGISAVAYDVPAVNCCLLSAVSSGVDVTVNNPTGGGGPLVAWVGPPSGGMVSKTFTVSTTATDLDGVAAVEYWCDPSFVDPCAAGEQYNGKHPDDCPYHAWFPAYSHWFGQAGRGAFLVATNDASDTSPYTAVVSSLPPGTFLLWSRAYDNLGGFSTTAPIELVVGGTVPLTVDIPIPSDSPVPAGDLFSIPAAVISELDEVAYVDFYVGEAFLARDAAAPYEASWSVPAGGGSGYVLSAKAFGLGGRTAVDTASVVSQ